MAITETVRKQWNSFLRMMLDEYHRERPDDKRPDREILTDIMENFVAGGLIKKDEDGKYIIGELTLDS